MTFASDIERFVTTTKASLDQVVRQAVVMAASGVINASPVGQPQLWKANANYYAMRNLDEDSRTVYNLFVDAANATRAEGEKKLRRLGKKRLEKGLKFRYSDYVGGRFRANWMLGIGQVNTTTTEEKDAGGTATVARIAAAMQDQKAGGVFYVTNSLPYAQRLEYEGWSSQAPNGMVRITMEWLPRALEQYVTRLNR